jgi:hypothetical protein
VVLVVVGEAGQQQQVGPPLVQGVLDQVHQFPARQRVEPLGHAAVAVRDLAAEAEQAAHRLDLLQPLPVGRGAVQPVVPHAVHREIQDVHLGSRLRLRGQQAGTAQDLVVGVGGDHQDAVKAAHSLPFGPRGRGSSRRWP